MPGSPPTTPLLGIPRIASTDPDNVPVDLNAVSDRIDAQVGPRLHDPGDLKMSARATAAAGWLLCDGAAVSRTTYATLYGAIGTAYGAGDGSTTFNVPDLRGRAPVGAGTGTGLTARTRGTTVGTETIALADMAAHNHGGGNHSHAIYARQDGGQMGTPVDRFALGFVADTTLILGSGTIINTEGAGAANGKMQPSAIVNVFIKT